jgi:hypothetical protein
MFGILIGLMFSGIIVFLYFCIKILCICTVGLMLLCFKILFLPLKMFLK